MTQIEITLEGGGTYQSRITTRIVDHTPVTLAIASGRDLSSGVFTQQMTLATDNETALHKTIRVGKDGRSEAVVQFGPGLGGSRMVLNCAVDLAKGTVDVSGSLDGKALAPFIEHFTADAQGVHLRADRVPIRLADGSAPPPPTTDARLVATMAAFAKLVDRPVVVPHRDSTGCVAACTLAAEACALACAASGVGIPLCGACIIAQSACISHCA